jgi:hypothetical protein
MEVRVRRAGTSSRLPWLGHLVGPSPRKTRQAPFCSAALHWREKSAEAYRFPAVTNRTSEAYRGTYDSRLAGLDPSELVRIGDDPNRLNLPSLHINGQDKRGFPQSADDERRLRVHLRYLCLRSLG